MLKLLEENLDNTLKHFGLSKNFPNRTQITQEMAPRIHRWDYMELKSFYTAEGTIHRVNRSLRKWKKTFASYTLDRGITLRIYHNLQNLNTKRILCARILCALSDILRVMDGSQEQEHKRTVTVFRHLLTLQSPGKCKQSKHTLRYHPPTPKQNAHHQQISQQMLEMSRVGGGGRVTQLV